MVVREFFFNKISFNLGLALIFLMFLIVFPEFYAVSFTTSKSRIPVVGKLWKTWFDKGIKAMDKKNYKRALSNFKTALMLDPSSSEILNNIGVVYYRKNEYTKAEGYFLRALSKNKKLIDPYINLGLVYYNDKKWNQLKQHALDFLKVFPGSGIAYFGLGVSSYYMEDYNMAEQYLEKSFEDIEASHEYAQEAKKLIIKSRAKEKKRRVMPWER